MRIRLCFLLLSLIAVTYNGFGQTTDLASVVEAQNLAGNEVSQVHIYEEFQYLITLINSGDTVNNVTFSQIIDPDVTVLSFVSESNSGGASEATNFNLTGTNELLGLVSTMPNNSSVEIKVVVRAPLNIGGIATSVTVFAPEGTEDTNISNNQSIISIDVTDLPIDFSVTNAQINPSAGTPLANWGDTITYQFTITNNSIIEYPLNNFSGFFTLSSAPEFGIPAVQFESLECVQATGGIDCVDTSTAAAAFTAIGQTSPNFSMNQTITFPSEASLTFEVTYTILEPVCTIETDDIVVNNFISLTLGHANESPNNSNPVESLLPSADLCLLTDVGIETTQLDPLPGTLSDWGDVLTFETVVTNYGPNPVPIVFFVQNLSIGIPWEIISVNCVDATNGLNCNDIDLNISALFWSTDIFNIPVGATITIQFEVRFLEPECSSDTTNAIGHLRSGINLQTIDIVDSNIINNAESDFVTLPATSACPSVDLIISKTQTAPILPEGSSSTNTTSWGNITYVVTVENPSDDDVSIIVRDYFQSTDIIATLQSVNCISTTGTAQCNDIIFSQIGVPLDGVPQDGFVDVFWSINEEDQWLLPAQSSITFETVIHWDPSCSTSAIPVINKVDAYPLGDFTDNDTTNNTAEVTTYLAPCIDLVVQTFPESTSVSIGQNFNWIVDITNSETSSSAVDVLFLDQLDSVFTITGTPTCQVTSGIADCIGTFNVVDNEISGIIPAMEAGSTVRITIPVTAPNFGGAFTNQAEGIPSVLNNEEVTPETNISISNVQVLAPSLFKVFTPDEIIVGNQSTLTFTITNLASNDAQSNISFTDNLPNGITLVDAPFWVESNGCTTTFSGQTNDTFVGVTDLNFPDGVSSCTFGVVVTSEIVGFYTNNNQNFNNLNNIDVSQTIATLNVIDDSSDVDIEIIKTVSPTEAAIGDEVEFTITATNLGTTTGHNIEVFESLPNGYELIGFNTSSGTYSDTTFIWSLPQLEPNQSETLSLIAQLISSQQLVNTASLFDLDETDRDSTNNIDHAEVELNGCLIIPQGVSPNNDGFNDVLIIPCIEDYPESVLKIFSRYGNLVYETEGYKNDWNGVPNKGILQSNKPLPVGTYFYVLQLDSISDPVVGWIYLNF